MICKTLQVILRIQRGQGACLLFRGPRGALRGSIGTSRESMEPWGLFGAFFIIHKSYACMKVVQSMVTIRLFTIIHIIGIKQLHTPPYHCLLAPLISGIFKGLSTSSELQWENWAAQFQLEGAVSLRRKRIF